MTETTENRTVAYLAQQAIAPTKIDAGTIYTIPDGHGGTKVVSTDGYAIAPRRANAARQVSDSESFVRYLEKHGLPQTEVYADTARSSIVAVIDAHEGAESPAGWEGHTVKLVLEPTKSWQAWMAMDTKWFSQVEFAEFIEQHATDVKSPEAGDLLKLAQDLYMTKDLEYQSSERLDNGETNLVYKEKVTTKGLGDLTVPKELQLVLQPYIDSPRQYAFASFRTRLDGARMRISYVLIRSDEILEGVFFDIVNELRNGRAAVPDKGIRAFDPIKAPIYAGRPQ